MYIQNDFSYSCEKNVMGSILNIQNFLYPKHSEYKFTMLKNNYV